jgi:hypothetical protein
MKQAAHLPHLRLGVPLAPLPRMRLFLICQLGAFLIACNRPLDAKRLRGEIKELRSIASETQLALDLSARGPAAFRDEQCRTLADNAKKSQRHLANGVASPKLHRAWQATSQIADKLVPAVERHDGRALTPLIEQLEHLEHQVTP